jgi:uncharacterized protein (TIGR00297 family)
MQPGTQLLAGLTLGIFVALAAYWLRALSLSGAVAAAITGSLVFGLGGFAWAALLLVFFISSSALSKAFVKKKQYVEEKYAKSSRRDWEQVLANGGLGALLAIAHFLLPAENWPWVAYAGALAAVNADTWATELGVLSQAQPRLISNGKRVARGSSGGVTWQGSLAGLAGSALVAACAALVFYPDLSAARLFLAATCGGLAGSLTDSWLGATVQSIYYCPACQKETERSPRHTCGANTQPLRGWKWVNNEVVNFACSLSGALVSTLIFL